MHITAVMLKGRRIPEVFREKLVKCRGVITGRPLTTGQKKKRIELKNVKFLKVNPRIGRGPTHLFRLFQVVFLIPN